MPIEQEVMGLVIWGFSIIMGITLLITFYCWVKNKPNHSGYVWTILHLLLFSGAALFFMKAMSSDPYHPMASEEISLKIGLSAMIWALSMMSLVFGIYSFSKEPS